MVQPRNIPYRMWGVIYGGTYICVTTPRTMPLKALHYETKEKMANGYIKVVRYG